MHLDARLILLVAAALAAATGKLDESTVSPDAAVPSTSADECTDEPPVPVVRGAQRVAVTEVHQIDGRTVHLRELHDELQLSYVHGLVGADEVRALETMADKRQGWVRSPLKAQSGGESLDKDNRRTSSSCPMLWPLVYRGREDELARLGHGDELALVANSALAEISPGLAA